VTRRIQGLEWARQLTERPAGIPVGHPRGRKAAGVRYERLVAAAIAGAQAGCWWEFRDQVGVGVCQTDLLLVGKSSALVLECKYTCTPDAWVQLEQLYGPVVSRALGLPVLLVQVCKVLTPKAGEVARELPEAIASARSGRRVVLHWPGVGRLWPRPAVPRPTPTFAPCTARPVASMLGM
jgi:hypothetical protein